MQVAGQGLGAAGPRAGVESGAQTLIAYASQFEVAADKSDSYIVGETTGSHSEINFAPGLKPRTFQSQFPRREMCYASLRGPEEVKNRGRTGVGG